MVRDPLRVCSPLRALSYMQTEFEKMLFENAKLDILSEVHYKGSVVISNYRLSYSSAPGGTVK